MDEEPASGKGAASPESLSELKFFESLDLVNRAMQGATDLEKMMSDCLEAVLSIFGCDRAFLRYPCDPEAAFWTCPVERTRPRYPGIRERGTSFPMTAPIKSVFERLLKTDGTIELRVGQGIDPEAEPWKTFEIRSALSIALYPQVGKPWQFGVHQCSYAREWTLGEKKLYREISRRMADGLTTLLMYRDLKSNQEFLDKIVENMPHVVFVKDAKTLQLVRLNKAIEGLLGRPREELLGKSVHDLFPAKEADFFAAKDREALEGKQLVDIPEETVRNAANEERILHTKKIPILDESGTPRYLLGISEDITERKRLVEQLHQSQKLDAIGQLAGGIAHDFNNVLLAVSGNAKLALMDLPVEHPLRPYLTEIVKGCDRATEFVRRMLLFSRPHAQKRARVRLQEAVSDALQLARATIPAMIRFETEFDANVPPIMADASQIHQIVINLVTNAAHAIGQRTGVIRFAIDEVHIDHMSANAHPHLANGTCLHLSVADTGCGMEPAVLARIYDPFFTTKPMGQGTGLGLSVVHGIMKSIGGGIRTESELGKGSVFHLYFPAAEAARSDAARAAPRKTTASGMGRRILYVDDESSLVFLMTRVLERSGYVVMGFTNPSDALQAFIAEPANFDAVVTDLAMPAMSGFEFASRIISVRPDTPILMTSGYVREEDERTARDIGVTRLVLKPDTVDRLVVELEQVLAQVAGQVNSARP